jgi:hypothetical protein
VDEDPPRIELQYRKPDPVFPTGPVSSFVFWGCVTVFILAMAVIALFCFWIALIR